MTRDALKSHFQKVNWTAFRAAAERIMAADANSTAVVAGLYERIRLGKIFPSRAERFVYRMICAVTPWWLLLRKLFISRWAYARKARELRLSRAEEIDGGSDGIGILIMMAAAVPSLYETPFRLLAQLDRSKVRTAALLFPPVVRRARAGRKSGAGAGGGLAGGDFREIEHCALISFGDEIERAGVGELFSAARRAKRQYQQAWELADDEPMRELLRINRWLVQLLFMFDNMYETAYRRLFSRIKPKVIVDNWFNGALRKVTKEMNIYTVMVQHGTQWGEDKPGVTPDEDELLIWGEFWRQNFEKRVWPSTRVLALGCPRFDRLAGEREEPRDPRFYDQYKLGKDKLTVTFLSQSHGFAFPETTRLVYQEVVRQLGALISWGKGALNFIIKLHPYDDRAYYEAALGPEILENVRFIKNELPLHAIFRHTDVAVSVTSTSILEAIAMDVAAVQFACAELPDWIDFCSEGGGYLVRSENELIQTVENLSRGQGVRNEARKRRTEFLGHTLANFGHATEAIATHLLEVAGRRGI